MLMWFTLAHAGDVWLKIDVQTRSGAVRLDLPAAVLEEGAPSVMRVDGEEVDLRDIVREVASLPEGDARSLSGTVSDGAANVRVEHRPAVTRSPTRLRMSGVEANGRGVNATLPLDGSSLGTATTSRGVRVQGLALELGDESVVDAIRRGKPTLLVDAVSPDGGRLKIESQ